MPGNRSNYGNLSDSSIEELVGSVTCNKMLSISFELIMIFNSVPELIALELHFVHFGGT